MKMALSAGLHEALREFAQTAEGANCGQATTDLGVLDELAARDLAQYEDGAYEILARLYQIEGHESEDSGKSSDSVGVSKDG